MKAKIVFLIGTILFIFLVGIVEVNAQSSIVIGEDTITQVTDLPAEKLIDKYVSQTGDAINEILASIKENFTDEAEFIWVKYVLKYKLNFFIALGVVGLGILLLGGSFLMKFTSHWDWNEGPGVLLVVSILTIVAGVIASLVNISYLLVPEVYVIQDLLEVVK